LKAELDRVTIDRHLRNLTVQQGRHHKQTRIPQTDYERSAPLHVKSVPTINIPKLKEMAKSTPFYAELMTMLRFVEDHEMYTDICRDEDVFKGHRSTALSPADFNILVNAGIFRRVPKGTIKRTGKVFTVYEARGHKKRVVQWPVQLNEELRNATTSNIKLSTVSQVHDGEWAVCFDQSVSFYQTAL
jgi:hypothetical protein